MKHFTLIIISLGTYFFSIFEINGQGIDGVNSPSILSKDVIREVPAPGLKCYDVTVDSIYLWVCDNTSRSFYRLISSNGFVSLTVPFPEGILFSEGITFDGKHIWACGWETNDGSGSKLFKIDRKIGLILGSFDYPGAYDGNWPHGITYANSMLWANNMKTKTLDKIDPDTGELLATLPAPTENSTGIAFYNKAFWTSDPTTGLIYKQDQYSGEVLGTMEMPAANCNGMEWEGEYLWTVSWETQTIYKLDIGQLNIPESLDKSISIYPNPCQGTVYLSLEKPFQDVMRLSVLDNLGKLLRQVHFDPSRGNKLNMEVDLKGLPAGIYFLKIETTEGFVSRKVLLTR